MTPQSYPLMQVNFESDNGLAPNKRQAITWTSTDQDAWRHGVARPQWIILLEACERDNI